MYSHIYETVIQSSSLSSTFRSHTHMYEASHSIGDCKLNVLNWENSELIFNISEY